MPILLRLVIARGRPVLPRVLRKWGAPCLTERLGTPGEVITFVRTASSIRPCSTATHAFPSEKRDDRLRINSGVRHEENEQRFYHRIMETFAPYEPTVFSKQDLLSLIGEAPSDISALVERDDWTEATTQEIVEAFRVMTAYAFHNELFITDSRFDIICSAIANRKAEFKDEEVLEIGKLHSLWNFPSSKSSKNYELLNDAYDSNCVSRYQTKWYKTRDMATILKAADVFYWQRTGNHNHFLRLMIYHLASKAREPHHLIQLMFYLGLMRSVPKTYKFYDLEKKIYGFRDSYSVPELALVVNSMFRLKSRLQYYPLLQEILVKSLKAFADLNDYLLVSVSKGFVRAPAELNPLIDLFQKKLLQRIDDFRNESLLHALWMFGSNNVVNDDFAQAMYERSLSNISRLRTKELTRIMTIYTEFLSPNRDLKKLAESVLAQFQDETKSEWFRKNIFIEGAVLHRILICGLCPQELLNEYFTKINEEEIAIEALGIDVHLEVFHPNYTGTRMNTDVRKSTFEHRFGNSPNQFVKTCGKIGHRSTFNLKFVEKAKEVCLNMVGGDEKCILVRSLVPSSGYIDVVLCVGEDGLYRPIPDSMRESELWELVKVPVENLQKGDKFVAITFVYAPTEYSTRRITCFQREKIAILKKLGYFHKDMPMGHWNNADNNTKLRELQTVMAEIFNQGTFKT